MRLWYENWKCINTRQLDLNEAKFQAKKVFNEGEKGGALGNVNVVLTRPQKRVFDGLQMPLSEVLVVLIKGGYLKPFDPTPLPNPIPPNWNRNDHYAFHQRIGHKTNSCLRLKHDVQNLIDQGVIAKTQPQEMASEKQARMNKGMCLRDLIHVNTFSRGWAISILLNLFQLSCLQFIESI